MSEIRKAADHAMRINPFTASIAPKRRHFEEGEGSDLNE
jgi:hypothetical protein